MSVAVVFPIFFLFIIQFAAPYVIMTRIMVLLSYIFVFILCLFEKMEFNLLIAALVNKSLSYLYDCHHFSDNTSQVLKFSVSRCLILLIYFLLLSDTEVYFQSGVTVFFFELMDHVAEMMGVLSDYHLIISEV